jgi:hypothetical protein
LVKASQLEGASAIQSLGDAPGGGYLVTAYDTESVPINLVHDVQPVEAKVYPSTLIVNYEAEKARERRFQRFKPGPAAVHKVRPRDSFPRWSQGR